MPNTYQRPPWYDAPLAAIGYLGAFAGIVLIGLALLVWAVGVLL